MEALLCQWPDLLSHIAKAAPMTKAYLVDSRPLRVEASTVVIGFDPEFADEIERLNYPRTRHAVQTQLGQVLGRQVSCQFEMLDAESALPTDHESSISSEHAQAQQTLSKTGVDKYRDNPEVQLICDYFNAMITDVRE